MYERWLNDVTKNIQTGFGHHFAAGRWHYLGNIQWINKGNVYICIYYTRTNMLNVLWIFMRLLHQKKVDAGKKNWII